jgi:outer membrane protein TolC
MTAARLTSFSRRRARFPLRLRVAHLALALGLTASFTRAAWAGPFDLDDDSANKPDDQQPTAASPPVVTVHARTYTLAECLALADRNHPNLWAARARLAYTHGQLQEAKWIPYWQWSANATFGVLPPITGTASYTAASAQITNLSYLDGIQPFFHFDISGVIPLYTFGKIDAGRTAAEAQVRVFEWDLEKNRQQTRMDVRRAYFGLMLARDARYLVQDVQARLDHAIDGIAQKLAKGDQGVEDADKWRLELYRTEIVTRAGDIDKGERFAISALRFMTGVQTSFDIPDVPLKRPDIPLTSAVRYLGAARLFRPEVNMARAGVAARKAQTDLARARLFPDIGLGLGGSYSTGPSATIQNNAWVVDPFNRFGYAAFMGMRWGLDLVPGQARVEQAESQLEEARALERLALGGIGVEVENAYGTALEAKNREEAWDGAEKKAKTWISSAQDAIDLGNKDERALLEPLRVYVNARVSHLQALMDYNIAMSDLARVSGWDSAAPTGE